MTTFQPIGIGPKRVRGSELPPPNWVERPRDTIYEIPLADFAVWCVKISLSLVYQFSVAAFINRAYQRKISNKSPTRRLSLLSKFREARQLN